MKKLVVIMLMVCIAACIIPAYADLGLYVCFDDTYINPGEEIIRDVTSGNFSFRGPAGWTQLPDQSTPGLMYVLSPSEQEVLIVFSYDVGIANNLDNEAQRKSLYDNLMTQYSGTSFVDVGNGRYIRGNAGGLPCIIYLYGEGTDLLVLAYSENAPSYVPEVSDLSPYAKTVIHN